MAEAKYDPKKKYVVAEGKSVTSLKGIRSAGMDVSEEMFATGKESVREKNAKAAMAHHVAKGNFVVKPEEEPKAEEKADDKGGGKGKGGGKDK